ncbi:MAG: hypothetical protein J0H21_11515, partial [Rhizobiales bacterium]|nr:hypothetical protein [Hyphomicrobiales bacterium]
MSEEGKPASGVGLYKSQLQQEGARWYLTAQDLELPKTQAPGLVPALENVALWHERDISHSSAERMFGPDATVTLDFALNRLAGVVEKRADQDL